MRAPFSRTLPDLLDEMAGRQGRRPVVIDGDRVIDYAELALRARRLAAGLRARGVKRADRIGILAPNRSEWLEICFGASAAGAVIVPISTWSKPAELAHIIDDAAIVTLFAVAGFAEEDFVAALRGIEAATPTLKMRVMVGAEPPDGWLAYEDFFAPESSPLAPGDAPSAADDALILYTSGSTSKPKAVRLAHYGLIENGFNIGERQELGPEDRILASVPLFWAYGAANLLPAAFTHGAAIVLQSRFEPAEALDVIERQQCTAIYTLPGMTSALIAHPRFSAARTASLRTGLTIGSPQDILNAAERLGVSRICNIYGASETYGNCCVTPAAWPLARRAESQGPPLPGVSLRVVDAATGATLPPGEVGLIEVSGYLLPGYGGQSADLNASVFTADGWFRMGDLGRLNEQGELIFAGRDSEMIKRAGINISPAEVEDVLMQHAAVSQAAVVGASDAARGEIIVAFVVCAAGAQASEADLVAHCRALASRYKVPDRIEFVDRLPMTATGKVQRQALKVLVNGQPSQVQHVA